MQVCAGVVLTVAASDKLGKGHTQGCTVHQGVQYLYLGTVQDLQYKHKECACSHGSNTYRKLSVVVVADDHLIGLLVDDEGSVESRGAGRTHRRNRRRPREVSVAVVDANRPWGIIPLEAIPARAVAHVVCCAVEAAAWPGQQVGRVVCGRRRQPGTHCTAAPRANHRAAALATSIGNRH